MVDVKNNEKLSILFIIKVGGIFDAFTIWYLIIYDIVHRFLKQNKFVWWYWLGNNNLCVFMLNVRSSSISLSMTFYYNFET